MVFQSASHNHDFSKVTVVLLMNGTLEVHGSNQDGKDCWQEVLGTNNFMLQEALRKEY